MKHRTTALFAMLSLALSIFCQTSNMAIVKGKLKMDDVPETISLYKVSNGEPILHSKVEVASDGSFGFAFKPEPAGLYRIGERTSPARIFVAPGKTIVVTISDTTYSVAPTDVENTKLVQWQKIIWKIKCANQLSGIYTYKEIFPIIPAVENEKNQFVRTLKTTNPTFDQFMKAMAEDEFEYELYHFLYMPRIAHPAETDMPEIYNRISSPVHFKSTRALGYDFGLSYISSFMQYEMGKSMTGQKKSFQEMVFSALPRIQNDTLKGWFLLKNLLLRSKTFDQTYRDNLDKVKPYILSKVQKETLAKFDRSIRTYAQGEQAINFEGTTPDGTKVSLTSLKGKVVVVDVWATWCSPCKKEIPFLKKLEEEYHGKDVAFVSYSIDEMKDADTWKKFVADEKLSGIQLMGEAAWKSAICTNYSIVSVPRFMVFDKTGKIVNVNAPRPSSPELKAMIDSELMK